MKNVLVGLITILGILVALSCNNCRDIDIPYEAIEEEQVEMTYDIGEHIATNDWEIGDVYAEGRVEVRNTDTETGKYTVRFTFTTLDDGDKNFTVTHSIMSGETVSFTQKYDIDMSEDFKWSYTVDVPYKMIQKKVTKYRKCNTCDKNCM